MRKLLVATCVLSLTGVAGASPNLRRAPPPLPKQQAVSVTILGTATFDLVPFSKTAGAGLDYSAIRKAPARGISVELVTPDELNIIATAHTNAYGVYTFENVPGNTQMKLRMTARMLTPNFTNRVCDHALLPSGTLCNETINDNAVYESTGPEFNSGTRLQFVQSVNAPSGWDGTAYSGDRESAAFAILDVAYQANQLVLSADPKAVLPPLNFYWSAENVAQKPATPEEFNEGAIGTTYYENNKTTDPAVVARGIYVLGAADDDTDEFDRNILAREFGKYYLEHFGRDDSIGGQHDRPLTDKLDLRVAFTEGFADAFSAMVTSDPVYRDSHDVGQAKEISFDLENDVPEVANRGWFSEGAIASSIYDFFDAAADGADTTALGFKPIHQAVTSLKTTPALTSIYAFANALRTKLPAAANGIAGTLLDQQISVGVDDFGSGELLNNGGNINNLPIYASLANGIPAFVCAKGSASEPPAGRYNRLGIRRLARFEAITGGTLVVTAEGANVAPSAAAVNPDVVVYRNGVRVGHGDQPGNSTTGMAEDEKKPKPPIVVPATGGTYVVETYHYNTNTRCIRVTATLTP